MARKASRDDALNRNGISYTKALGGPTIKIDGDSDEAFWVSGDGYESFLDPKSGDPLAIVIRPSKSGEGIKFMTKESEELQVGLLRWNTGHRIESHSHRPLRRVLESTAEVLFVRSGKVEMTLFTSEGGFLNSRVLSSGDVVALFRGGHGFRILEDADIVEVKQGPYTGIDEKYRFPVEEAP